MKASASPFQSPRASSALADPGGRTEIWPGSKAEEENGPALLSPCPTQAGYWCSRQEKAATGCEFEAASETGRVMQTGSNPGFEATTGDSHEMRLVDLDPRIPM